MSSKNISPGLQHESGRVLKIILQLPAEADILPQGKTANLNPVLETLITSKLRVKLLTKFFINPQIKAWLRGLESEMGVSSNAVRQELNKLEYAGLLCYEHHGNKKLFKANPEHPLYQDLHRILMKTFRIDLILNLIVTHTKGLKSVYLTGALARGVDTNMVELCIVGDMNKQVVDTLIKKAENIAEKKVTAVAYSSAEWDPGFLNGENYVRLYGDRTK